MLRVLFGCRLFCNFADGEPCTLCALALHGQSSPVPDIYGRLFNLNFWLMAIVNSLAIGKSVKSAGNLTYKTVRGRTIASQRITKNTSKTAAQSSQRSKFGSTAQCMQLFLPYVNNFFEKTRYGSARNQYVRVNKFVNLNGLLGEVKEGIVPMSEAFLLLFGRDSSDKLLSGSSYYASYGTLSCIVNETPTAGDNVSIDVSAEFMCNKNVLFTFTTAPLKDTIKLKTYLVNSDGASNFNKAIPTYKEYTLSAEDIAALATLGYKITVVENDSIISSINIEAIEPSPESDCKFSVGIIVPSINNKVPTLLNVMQVQATEPLP